jgi:hypothetical protein
MHLLLQSSEASQSIEYLLQHESRPPILSLGYAGDLLSQYRLNDSRIPSICLDDGMERLYTVWQGRKGNAKRYDKEGLWNMISSRLFSLLKVFRHRMDQGGKKSRKLYRAYIRLPTTACCADC